MSEPAITDLEIWAKGREQDHSEKTNHGHTKESKTSTGDEGPDPYCCAPTDPDPDPDEG
jgi:hypothetical protein